MKRIALREFQLHASKYLEDLPLELTQYNISVATVIPFSDKDISHVADVLTESDKQDESVNSDTQHCEAPLCKGYGPLYEGVGYTDEGERRLKKYLCTNHYKSARKAGEEIHAL